MSLSKDDNCYVANARMAAGLDNVIRCASTDVLAGADTSGSDIGTFDAAILRQAGLIFDLRSPSERNEAQAQTWMSTVANEPFVVKELDTEISYSEAELSGLLQTNPRLVVRLDVLSPSRFMSHLEQNWLTPGQTMQANLFKIVDGNRLHNLRMETLNSKGLLGLNEAILETGKQGLCTALQLITLHLEQQAKNDNVEDSSPKNFDLIAIHCVQGKDRTGLLVMLCQAMMGVSDDHIIEDYYKSHNVKGRRKEQKTSAAMERATATTSNKKKASAEVKLDRSIFHSAPREVMQATVEYLRSNYGSIAPGYLEQIGFDASWQQRFQVAASGRKAPALLSKL
ncbi:Inherit from COG: protein tyrosine serine phosphatase [Seminavis robusta]|uniref:Inherit from COG: protein tyrosine serine phosphatase n=1 Tax=Seminavis robusta TaxID=568900 RepID=A0A9N8HYG9_9STRA|nr:Inherit from COG: protein tyrosine serine phosphatase [Seminavis robusta]|eukprot:Sro2851_g338590.1 Inherit from COG: protein tyrosine serine phosphatase (340) ;mRNA; r:7281-8300